MQARRFISLWLGLALGAGTCVGVADARTLFDTLYLADYRLLEPTELCAGEGAKLIESTMVATGVPTPFNSYLRTADDYCEMTIRRGGESFDVPVDCETRIKLPPQEAREPEVARVQSVEIRAKLQMCIRPTSIQAELVGPVEVSRIPGDEVFRIARGAVNFQLRVPGRTVIDPGWYGATTAQPDGAYVALDLYCLPGGPEEATGRELFAVTQRVHFKIAGSLPEECVKGRCQLPYRGRSWFSTETHSPTCTRPGAKP